MKIKRTALHPLIDEIVRPEVSILFGPRQVRKTFLLDELKEYTKRQGMRPLYFNLENPHDLHLFNVPETELFDMLTRHTKAVFIDEFHYLKNASSLFKAIYDSKSGVKIFCSGSSSMEIHKHLKESLAGRRLVTRINPLSFAEFSSVYPKRNSRFLREKYILLGGLPGLVHLPTRDEQVRLLNGILETYIQKDIKSLLREENIRAFNTLLYLLAESQGQLVSTNSLAGELGLTAATVTRYISILEATYVCFSLASYSRRIGNELKKSRKIYFYDLGIRNMILKDFSPLQNRQDKGALHESFVFLELNKLLKPDMELKFWRNKAGQEIDFVLLKNRQPLLIEVKSGSRENTIPDGMRTFIRNYPETLGGILFSESAGKEMEYEGKKVLFASFDRISETVARFIES